MDLETENRIATILMKEAAELRRQAEKEGVHVYLRQPNVRGRPNSRFLTATVLGVQQSNRAVEVNEMWRVRQKELELNDRIKGRMKGESSSCRSSPRSTTNRLALVDDNASASSSSSKRAFDSGHSGEDEGLRDEEIEEFLHSRVKRGRGAVGSRMDETGPYLPPCPDSQGTQSTNPDFREHRVVFGPEKPSLLKSYEFSDDEFHEDRRKKAKMVHSGNSSKKHSKKHKSKEKSRDKKKRRKEEKRSKHHK